MANWSHKITYTKHTYNVISIKASQMKIDTIEILKRQLLERENELIDFPWFCFQSVLILLKQLFLFRESSSRRYYYIYMIYKEKKCCDPILGPTFNMREFFSCFTFDSQKAGLLAREKSVFVESLWQRFSGICYEKFIIMEF